MSVCPEGCLTLDEMACTSTENLPSTAGRVPRPARQVHWKHLGDGNSVEELLAELVKDRAYYEKSGGGVTLSGGEPSLPA